jgi:hypothetical protein
LSSLSVLGFDWKTMFGQTTQKEIRRRPFLFKPQKKKLQGGHFCSNHTKINYRKAIFLALDSIN